MILPIQIDTQSLGDEFQLGQSDVDSLLEAVTAQARAAIAIEWRNQAKGELGSTRSRYMNSIIEGQEGRFTGTITLVGQLPNMIENGASAFDMKNGFANSDKRKTVQRKDGKLGWYLTIPFTYARPGSLGESEKFSGVLPIDVNKALLKVTEEDPDASLGASDIPGEYAIPKIRKEIKLFDGSLAPEYQNKSSIYSGLKVQKNPSGGSQVISFRRVSDNSDDNSWIHTGIEARNLADKALREVKLDEVVGDVIDVFLNEL